MPAPWNESCPGEHLSFGSFAIPLAQNLSHRSHAIPLGFTPWNSFSACLLAKNDRIGGDHLDLLNRGHVIPLGLYAPCSMHHACRSTGVRPFLKKVSHKAPPTHIEGGAFFFSYPVGLKAYFTGASYDATHLIFVAQRENIIPTYGPNET